MESKKFMSLFLVVVMILSIFFASADAARTNWWNEPRCMTKDGGCGPNILIQCCGPYSCKGFDRFNGWGGSCQ
ncbi:hypothetical protein MKX01_031156 [Papaver californicum]|nr:hypothetical protein MKX01_031156 [Papaver californicum]